MTGPSSWTDGANYCSTSSRPRRSRGDPRRAELKATAGAAGSGRASIDSAGYRLVWEIRLRIVRAVLSPLTARCRAADPDFRLAGAGVRSAGLGSGDPVAPPHLLDPAYPDWDSLLLAMIDATLAEATVRESRFARGHGARRTSPAIEHPISVASPLSGDGSGLNMPAEPLPGGRKDMPRIQGPTYGASQRMVVTPGRESDGYFHMPCGQSGHPLSPHYRDGHDGLGDWQADPVPARARPSTRWSSHLGHPPDAAHGVQLHTNRGSV